MLDLGFLPTPIAARLKELTVNGRFLDSTADYVARACPNLEKLAFDLYIQGEHCYWGEHVGWTPGLDALLKLKLGCPKLTTIPLLAIHGSRGRGPGHTASMNGPAVDQLFALLREWPTLQKVLIHSVPDCEYRGALHHSALHQCTMDFASESQAVVKRAGKDVQLGHGSFVGKLSVEFLLFDDDTEYCIGDQLLLDQPHVSVHLVNIEA